MAEGGTGDPHHSIAHALLAQAMPAGVIYTGYGMAEICVRREARPGGVSPVRGRRGRSGVGGGKKGVLGKNELKGGQSTRLRCALPFIYTYKLDIYTRPGHEVKPCVRGLRLPTHPWERASSSGVASARKQHENASSRSRSRIDQRTCSVVGCSNVCTDIL